MKRLLWLALAFAACSNDDGSAPGERGASSATQGGAAGSAGEMSDPFAVPPRCTTGISRDPNESEGPEMMPGHACIACHVEDNAASGEGDAPVFAFAGTLYATAHEPDDCAGAEGAEVVVTDARGAVFTTTANRSGNFFVETSGLMKPFRASVRFRGRERAMVTPQTDGDCNWCHTATGANSAPGRIVLP